MADMLEIGFSVEELNRMLFGHSEYEIDLSYKVPMWIDDNGNLQLVITKKGVEDDRE